MPIVTLRGRSPVGIGIRKVTVRSRWTRGPWPSNALAASTNATRPFAASMANRPGRGRRAGGNRLRSSLYPAWPELEAACRDLQSADSMSALPWPRGADVAGGDSEVPGLRMGRLLASIAERVRGDSDSAGGLRARTADVQRAGECGMSHDRGGGSDQDGNPPRRPLAGGRAWWKGCRAPQGHGQGPLPPLCGAPPFAKAALEQLNALGVNAAANPPGQRRGGPWLGLGQGVKRLSRGVVRRRGQLMDLAIDGGHIADRGGASACLRYRCPASGHGRACRRE